MPIFVFFLLAFIISVFMGCSPSGEDFDKHLDVFTAVKARIQENTGNIHLKREGYVHPDLFAGWDRSQPDFLWASALKIRAGFNCLSRPSGASILTGFYPKNHKTTGRFGKILEEIITFPEILKKEGYMTSAFNGNDNLNQIFGFSLGSDKYEELSGIYPGTLNITEQ